MSKFVSLTTFDINAIAEKWLGLEKTPNVFAYSLNIRNQKQLPGKYNFYAEYNPERSCLRRPPQAINSLNPPYNEEKFNFNKIDPMEHIVAMQYNGTEVSFIINKSPLTKYHILICPDLKGQLSQRITLDSLRFCTAFLRELDDKGYRIGFNSPGALASVNHLHWHLIYVDRDLYIDQAELEPLISKHIFRLSKDMPTEAICWYICSTDSEQNVDDKLKEVYNFLLWVCDRDRPHNLFMTPVRKSEDSKGIKIFFFVRENYCIIKDLQSLNIGFCEVAGYVPVGNQEVYENLTEELVITKIRNETGNVYNEVYNHLLSTETKE